MGKKKNKVAKLTEEQYFAYIAGLKSDAALFGPDGEMVIPSPFKGEENKNEEKDY